MSLLTIITGIIIVVGIGVGVYFFVKNKSKKPPTNSDIPTSLKITVGKIQNRT